MRPLNVIRSLIRGDFFKDAAARADWQHHEQKRRDMEDPATLEKLASAGRSAGKKPELHYLEFHLTDHCNLRCKGCSHFSSLSRPAFADVTDTDAELTRLASLVTIDTLRLMGGEPLLHPEVIAFLKSARKHFPESTIALVTNGLLLPKMDIDFWEAVAHENIRIDISGYPIDIDEAAIRERCADTGIALTIGGPVESFLPYLYDERPSRNPQAAFALCRTLKDCPYLENGRIYPCASIPLARILNEKFGTTFTIGEQDFIDLKTARDGWEIIEFLAHPVPWCAHCAFDAGAPYAWSTTSGAQSEWLID